MSKRGKLEILRDILEIIKNNRNSIKSTPLLRKSNMSSTRFKEYYNELMERKLVIEVVHNGDKFISLTEHGFKFLERYKAIVDFIDEFEL